MSAPNKTVDARGRAPAEYRLACGLALLVLAGCDTAMEAMVGKPPGSPIAAAPTAPPLPLPTTTFIGDSDLSPGYTNQTIVPPTLPNDPYGPSNSYASGDSGAEPVAAAGPRKPIASAPVPSNPAALSALAAAANREKDAPVARFVLLVLTPPAADAATLDTGGVTARQAASAALKSLADAGIPAEHIDVSLATTATAEGGEMRLYRR